MAAHTHPASVRHLTTDEVAGGGELPTPAHIRRQHGGRNHGNCICHGKNAGRPPDPHAAQWHPVDATPATILPRQQLLETVFGNRIRHVSRDTIAQLRRVCPGVQLQDPRHCFHAVFSPAVLQAFMEPLNANLMANHRPCVDVREFVRWIATLFLLCSLPNSHAGARAFVMGANRAAVAQLVPYERFHEIKASLKLLTGHDRSNQVGWAGIASCGCAPSLFVLRSSAIVFLGYGLQAAAAAVKRLQGTLAHRCCDLFYVDGVVISIDDWRWKCSAKDVPFAQKVAGRLAWVAANATTLPHKFVLATQKQLRDKSTGNIEASAVTCMELARRLTQMPHGRTTITCKRGFTTYQLARQRTCTVQVVLHVRAWRSRNCE